jgi:NitT/TauT family transport system ATP-binding protein
VIPELEERMSTATAVTGTESLSFENIGMIFPDGTEAIRDVSFSIRKGEFVTVVGPSGCGKSTLLKIASGLLEPTSGQVLVDRDHLGYVFQDATLLPWRTVQKNVELLAELHNIPKEQRSKLAADAISLVGLEGFEGHYPKSLSGGMRMRASLARTLTLSPPVFLFDEPFGAVDEITREHLNEETQQLFQREGFAGLFITHSIGEAVFMSTRVLVMSARPGRIVAEFEVPFAYPRSPDLRFDPEFARLSGEVSHSLRGSHS